MNITEITDPDTEQSDDCSCLKIDSSELDSDTAELIANWLIAKYRSKIIYSCIDDVFGDMDEDERDAVFDSVCDIITGRYSLEHLNYIKGKISDFFEINNEMNIDGFVNFRLKAYRAELKTLVEECGYDMFAYKDYRDFIDVMNFLFDITDFKD